MGDVDAGNVKARASIEYDPSGLKQMKEDLASLGQAAGSAGESAGQASDKMAGLGESMSGSAGGAKEFSAALEELPKIAEGGTSAVAEMSGVLEEHRAVAEEAGAAQETFSKQVESTASSFEKATPSIQAATEHTQKFAQSVQVASESISQSTSSWGNNASENMAVFEDALVNPYPFQMIDQHLVETGQTWSGFTSSIGDENTSILSDMATYGQKTYDVLDGVSSQVKSTGQTFIESATSAEEFTKQFNGVADSTASASKAINEFGGVGSAMYGPMPKMAESIGFGEAFANAGKGLMGALNDVAMPLMAVQMIGMAVQATGQAIYDSAALVEGKAAHSYGTFTGTVDALGQSIQNLGGQFSESFGQSIMPTLNVLNAQFADQGGIAGALGESAGGAVGILFNLGQIASGINPMGGIAGLESMFGITSVEGPGPISSNPMQKQIDQYYQQANDPQYLASQAYYQSAYAKAVKNQASWDTSHYTGTTGPLDPMNEILQAQVVRANGGIYGTVPEDPNLAWLNDLGNPAGGGSADFFSGRGGSIGTSTGGFTYGGYSPENDQQSWGGFGDFVSNLPGIGVPRALFGGGGPYNGLFGPGSDLLGGVGHAFSELWNRFNFNLGDSESMPTDLTGDLTGGCFVAGTRVLLANGDEKPIEVLQIGECVLAHDGEKQVRSTIIDRITFPAKQIYKLTFSDGNVLVTTDSHPIATPEGWKSISPASTAQENPGLAVTQLHIGDYGVTERGTLCRLISIQKRDIAPVYNITVNPHHTYYAGGILVHNAKASSVGSMSNGGVGSEQVQLSHTFTANVQWEANNLQKQFTGVAQWAGQNLANTFMGAASWVGQNLANTFNGVANWVGQGLANTFNGVANWIGQNLANTFNGVADWVGQNLANTFNGVASWVGQGLSNTFKGVASWMGSGLEHTFNAVANWTSQNLTPNFTVNPSFTMLAEGTSNWGGGPAIVGEAGPEVVEHGGQYTMFDAGATLLNLPSGANVYPMKNLQSAGVAQFADGTGGNYTLPLNIGLKGGNNNAPESVNIYLQVDGQTFWSATGVSLAQGERLTSGNRSY